jgi:hypothetical protein
LKSGPSEATFDIYLGEAAFDETGLVLVLNLVDEDRCLMASNFSGLFSSDINKSVVFSLTLVFLKGSTTMSSLLIFGVISTTDGFFILI